MQSVLFKTLVLIAILIVLLLGLTVHCTGQKQATTEQKFRLGWLELVHPNRQ